MYMFEERLMPPEPEDQLEKLFASEEQAIRDDGFSARVEELAARGTILRQFAIYGSALAGLGFALGGIVELGPYLPNMTGWIESAITAVESVDIDGAVQGASNGALLVVAALAAGITCLLTAFSLQNR